MPKSVVRKVKKVFEPIAKIGAGFLAGGPVGAIGVGLGVAGDLLGAREQRRATGQAAGAQIAASQAGQAEQRRQFDVTREALDPFMQAGEGALGQFAPYQQAGQEAVGGLGQFASTGVDALQQQRALMGLGGSEAQQSAIDVIEASPEYQAMIQQGEEALLQNAAATGGLRGGNTQAALAQFRPAMLAAQIDKQYGRLGGLAAQGGNVGQFLAGSGQQATGNLAGLGQASAAGVGSAAQTTGANIAKLMQQGGAAQAGGILAGSAAKQDMWGAGLKGAGKLFEMGRQRGII